MKKLTNEHINLTINQKGICMDKNRIIMFASDEKPKKGNSISSILVRRFVPGLKQEGML